MNEEAQNMVDPTVLFTNGQTICPRCGQANDLGSSEALYWTDDSKQCEHCGFLFIRHKNRQMAKMMEMLKTNPEWIVLLRTGRTKEIKRRLDELVPIDVENDKENSGRKGRDTNG